MLEPSDSHTAAVDNTAAAAAASAAVAVEPVVADIVVEAAVEPVVADTTAARVAAFAAAGLVLAAVPADSDKAKSGSQTPVFQRQRPETCYRNWRKNYCLPGSVLYILDIAYS